jgi:hypothetical protein
MMGNEYYQPQFNTNMYGGQQYGQPMMDRLSQMRQQYNPPPMNQPMNQMPMNQNVPYSNLVKVLNASEANGYVVAPGNTVYMVTKDYKEMYIKTVDMNGDPNMRYFQITEYHPESVMMRQENDYVTRAEFTQLVNENNRMLAMIQQLTEAQNERNPHEYAEPSSNIPANHAVRTTVPGRPENGGHETD